MPIVEIGKGNIYVPDKISISKTKKANGDTCSLTLTVPGNQPLPKPPLLVNVVAQFKGVQKQVFCGWLKEIPTEFVGGVTYRRYNLSVQDLYSFTGFKPIENYKRKDFLANLIADLINKAGCNQGAAVRLLNYTVIGSSDPTNQIDPDPPLIDLGWQGSKYLHEAFDLLASAAGYQWEIGLNNILSLANLTTGYLARAIFRKNGIAAISAPRSPIDIPAIGSPACDVFFESIKLRVVGPQYSRVEVIGKNGDSPNRPTDGSTSTTEILKRDIPAGSQETEFSYPGTVTKITQVQLVPKS